MGYLGGLFQKERVVGVKGSRGYVFGLCGQSGVSKEKQGGMEEAV